MLQIKENQKLNIENLLSFRGKIKQAELENIGKEMDAYIKQSSANKSGNPVTATYSIAGDSIDVEVLIPIDKKIESSDKFVFKEQIKIVNAVVASYKGHPVGLQDACNQLNQYMAEHRL